MNSTVQESTLYVWDANPQNVFSNTTKATATTTTTIIIIQLVVVPWKGGGGAGGERSLVYERDKAKERGIGRER